MGGRGLQKSPEYVVKSDLKDETLYCPYEFVHDHGQMSLVTLAFISVQCTVFGVQMPFPSLHSTLTLTLNLSTFSPAYYFPPSNIEWGEGVSKEPKIFDVK